MMANMRQRSTRNGLEMRNSSSGLIHSNYIARSTCMPNAHTHYIDRVHGKTAELSKAAWCAAIHSSALLIARRTTLDGTLFLETLAQMLRHHTTCYTCHTCHTT